MKRITCPPLCGIALNLRGEPVEWGMAEYIQDFLLVDALGTVELCDLAIRLAGKLTALRGAAQVGQSIDLADDEFALLRALATRRRDPGSAENLVAFAVCNRAIFLAETVTNEP